MSVEHAQRVRAIAAIAFTALLSHVVHAQGRTDVVTLANGDRITGEVIRLDRGRLEFKTDDAGTLYLEWEKLVSVVAARVVEVVTSSGSRFLGTLGPGGDRAIAVVGADGGVASLRIQDVTIITPIGGSFWRKLDGSIDSGFSYTKSSGVAQLNFNSDTVYRRPASQVRLTASFTGTETNDESGRDDRGSLEGSYLKYPWREWFITAVGRLETNESLGLELRSQAAVATGPRLVNSNRAQLGIGAGVAFNNEQGVDVEATQSLEALFMFRMSFYTYDFPKTNLDVSTLYYPSLSDPGRQRLQLDASVKREFWKDLFLALNMFDTFDSRPPTADADKNDVGVVVSIGWSY